MSYENSKINELEVKEKIWLNLSFILMKRLALYSFNDVLEMFYEKYKNLFDEIKDIDTDFSFDIEKGKKEMKINGKENESPLKTGEEEETKKNGCGYLLKEKGKNMKKFLLSKREKYQLKIEKDTFVWKKLKHIRKFSKMPLSYFLGSAFKRERNYLRKELENEKWETCTIGWPMLFVFICYYLLLLLIIFFFKKREFIECFIIK